jgi:hypothetical protein
MKLTPAQIAMELLFGHRPRMGWKGEERIGLIRRGREWLARMTRQDFGYDALRWQTRAVIVGASQQREMGAIRRESNRRP